MPRGTAVKPQSDASLAPSDAPKSHLFPHFCLLDRYLMQFLKIIYIHIHYIYVNDFGAPSHTHNFNTVNFYKSVIDFEAPEKNSKFCASDSGSRFKQRISLQIACKIASICTKNRFRLHKKIVSDSGFRFIIHENCFRQWITLRIARKVPSDSRFRLESKNTLHIQDKYFEIRYLK